MIEKSTEFNESVFVLYHVLSSIYQNFDGRFPKDIDEKIEELMRPLISHLDCDIEENREIEDIKYYRTLLLHPENDDENSEL